MSANSWYQPGIVALVLGTIILLALPDFFTKYTLTIQEKIILRPEQQSRYYFVDMDGDGITEQLHYHLNTPGIPSLLYITEIGGELFQFPGKGEYINRSKPLIGDYDNDSLMEVFFPYIRNDSVFLAGAEHGAEWAEFNDIFVTIALPLEYRIDIGFRPGAFYDLNGDGYKEAIFSINGGYILEPRRLYAFDIKNQEIIHSETLGPPLVAPIITDLDGDGNVELIPIVSVPFNLKDDSSSPYLDRYPWLFVFDNRLDLKYPAKKVVDRNRSCQPYLVHSADSIYLVILTYRREMKDLDSMFHIANKKGEIVLSKPYPLDTVYAFRNRLIQANDRMLFFKNDGKVYELNNKLEFHFIKNLRHTDDQILKLNIDSDSLDEFIAIHKERDEITVYQSDLSHPVSMKFPQTINIPDYYSVYLNHEKFAFSVVSDSFHWLVGYEENPYYMLKYLFYLGVYLLVFSLVWGVKKIQKLNLASKQKGMMELQLKSFREQFDTHFTFNIMNSISSSILHQEKEQAYQLFNQFSMLLRRAFENSDKTFTTLEDDLAYAREYLSLQQFRYHDKLMAEITTAENIDWQQKVPKLMIYSFVENALKHGLLPKEGPGTLEINIDCNNGYTIIKITDDGIGRKASAGINHKGFGQGLELIKEYFSIFYNMHRIRVGYNIDDLKDKEGKAAGTMVTISIKNKQHE